ncbi:apolipoprotein N-acyltransferase [Pontixanthobacter aestiaquae]|uniref:Apolipoprotein N-acyltransferase n=1 Tax=Pontixanthobacter aestiaquae TaxID=1509367 RepID=A0A844Z3Q1_9SPHN|nr:apolipoprotein N-acyltransferase [Pontixanthobacter aestiaquae]MDN3647128.1 apolipoprotein N-acyltransferase [Pontixanthobacter aestiaquae]MXO81896.1 apolipoprotein N-acyltransferase [Pontixanthobacter aestiaquae]
MTALARFAQFSLARPRWLALLLGALAATGFPPLALWPLTLLAIAGLIWLIFTATGWRDAAMRGWLFGVGHFTLANNWIATAFTYQSEMPAALGWVAVPLLALYLAVYPALAAMAAKLLSRHQSIGWFGLLFAGTWAIAEWLRSWVFTGFAWDPLGLVLLGPFNSPGLAAALPWVGTYALSGLVIVITAMLLALAFRRKLLTALLVAVPLIAGMYLIVPEQREGTLAFTLIQPDIRQEELNDASKFEGHFIRSALLSRKQRDVEKRLVLWPESGVPDYIRDGYPQRYYKQMTVNADPALARFRLGRVAGEGGMLLTGNVDLEIENGRAAGARNAVTAINEQGELVAGYDKAHLVPYGEYLALRWLLEPLGATRLVAGSIDFWPGPGPQTLKLGDWGNAGIQICYEIVFSGDVVDPDNRPDYIFNPSNDGWFGSWGPPQHLAQARMRAIEEGLPVLRSTTTGISAVIDADGIVRDHIGMRRDARIDGFVPPAKAPTLFSKLGNWLPMGWAFLAIALSLVATRLRRG